MDYNYHGLLPVITPGTSYMVYQYSSDLAGSFKLVPNNHSIIHQHIMREANITLSLHAPNLVVIDMLISILAPRHLNLLLEKFLVRQSHSLSFGTI